MFNPVNSRQSFPELEDGITSFWKENEIFKKSVEQRPANNKYVFYDGPPFITGTPHYGSLLPSIAKDVVPRYWTMNGKRVERQWGWDCHGLPIENKVEKALKLKNKKDIEELGIQNFVDKCYSYTRSTSAEWKWYVDKIGRWVDFDNSYKTMDQDYMESVIWMFKELYDKELIYEGHRTSLFCTRCGTPVSNFEIAMDNSYTDMEDPAVTIKFIITTEGKFAGTKILAWTTTPWTLPANKALVIDPESTYVTFTTNGDAEINIHSDNKEILIAAKPRLEALLDETKYTIVEEFLGKELLGLAYEPLFDYFPSSETEHKVYAYPGMVHMAEGTGIVHSAPGFGDIDSEMGKKNKLGMANSVNDNGTFVTAVTDYAGMYVKKADVQIIEDLTKSGVLFKSERITHRYPFCYRCETPLLHKAQPSWFIDVQKIKNLLKENNEKINWIPAHLKTGRFLKGLETAPDWCISRNRYWATPMPVWQKKEDGKIVERVVIGSRDELRTKSVQPITKITFVRHGEYDTSITDGQLSDKGWKQVETLNARLKETDFDAIYTSSMKRSVQTADEIAAANTVDAVSQDGFGSVSGREISDKIHADLKAKHNVVDITDLDEEVLQKAFKPLLDKAQKHLIEMLVNNKGNEVLVVTHEEEIAFIRTLAEGRNLKETLAMTIDYTKSAVLYFNGTDLMDLHRPKIDGITIKGETGELTRVEEVLDVWMDSASMPYASKHYPFKNKAEFEANYPADFIVEYIAQTRAWFYVMHVISSALFGTNSFNNVVTTGVIFGTDGRKMSKSYGNYPDPKKILNQYGAEALRLYLMGAKIMVGEDINMDEGGIREQVKTIMLPLWNSYSFLVTYANIHNWKPSAELAANVRKDNPDTTHIQWDHIPFNEVSNGLDQWIIAKLQLVIRNSRIAMEEYNIPAAVKEIPNFVDDLSKWYIRRSRDRFNAGDTDALSTLYYVLVEFAKVMAPVAPFMSEAIYQNLVTPHMSTEPMSVHLCEYPHPDINFLEKSEKVMMQMEKVRSVVALGQSLRVQHGLKVKQPLAEIEVLADMEQNKEYDFEAWMKKLIKDELNIKVVDEKHSLTEREGWLTAEDDTNDIKISLDAVLTTELKREGLFRQVLRKVQNLRKKNQLKLGDKINLSISTTDEDILVMLDVYKDEFAKIVDADTMNISKKDLPDSTPQKVVDKEFQVAMKQI